MQKLSGITVFINVAGARLVALNVQPQLEISTMLRHFVGKMDVCLKGCSLKFGAKILKKRDKIYEVNIDNGSTLFLLWILKGGLKST